MRPVGRREKGAPLNRGGLGDWRARLSLMGPTKHFSERCGSFSRTESDIVVCEKVCCELCVVMNCGALMCSLS